MVFSGCFSLSPLRVSPLDPSRYIADKKDLRPHLWWPLKRWSASSLDAVIWLRYPSTSPGNRTMPFRTPFVTESFCRRVSSLGSKSCPSLANMTMSSHKICKWSVTKQWQTNSQAGRHHEWAYVLQSRCADSVQELRDYKALSRLVRSCCLAAACPSLCQANVLPKAWQTLYWGSSGSTLWLTRSILDQTPRPNVSASGSTLLVRLKGLRCVWPGRDDPVEKGPGISECQGMGLCVPSLAVLHTSVLEQSGL